MKSMQKSIDNVTDEFAENTRKVMNNFQGNEFLNSDGSIRNQPKLKAEEKWVEREENEELKEYFKKADEEWMDKIKESMGEGDSFTNLNPFSKEKESDKNDQEGIQGSGTYVMKKGKLVKGEGRKREEVMFSNWYCSNADPEDLRKHRELMDRFTFKGPKWDNVEVPKSILEEEDPIYRKIAKEENPREAK
eukprot:CAMPEP_0205815010 /NCGR_PEP_ID=MMETSP0205-20121125/20449_1 /ASSEMBLY_ACC=CAM_ASM_000278 /TAXON_ID=36767 /ORGANISM="Euplotes focardii, Strain TN1" /LENGTH=190 /DNA_ID=CAMNT_0053100231 /DNA_START=403 /DNA_END=972 /DNA_ORIENTATION=+